MQNVLSKIPYVSEYLANRALPTVVNLRLTGSLPEAGQASPLAPFLVGNPALAPMSLQDAMTTLDKAAVDPKVREVVVKIGAMEAGPAKLGELRAKIEKVAKVKPVTAHVQSGSEFEYYLASAATTVTSAPHFNGSPSFIGLPMQKAYTKELWEKLGVTWKVFASGEAKDFAEGLTRMEPSSGSLAQTEQMLGSLVDHWVHTMVASRPKMSEADARAVFGHKAELLDAYWKTLDGPIQKGLVDRREWFDNTIAKALGLPQFEAELGAAPGEPYKGPEQKATARLLEAARDYRRRSARGLGLENSRNTIGVVNVIGQIVRGNGQRGGFNNRNPSAGHETVIADLRAAAEDPRIKAVIMRINSPGGDATASELILREVQRTASRKPVVASMSDVAASGGYMVSLGAHAVYADPLTFTGSIGAVSVIPQLGKVAKKAGIALSGPTAGPYASLRGSSMLEMDPQVEKYIGDSLDRIASDFEGMSARRRGLAIEDMNTLGGGRVWLGRDAAGHGLIDGLGGMEQAVDKVKELTGLHPMDKVKLRSINSGRRGFMSMFGGGSASTGAPDLAKLEALASGDPLAIEAELFKALSQVNTGPQTLVHPDDPVNGMFHAM